METPGVLLRKPPTLAWFIRGRGAPGTRRRRPCLLIEKQAQISTAACRLVPPSVTTCDGPATAGLLVYPKRSPCVVSSRRMTPSSCHVCGFFAWFPQGKDHPPCGIVVIEHRRQSLQCFSLSISLSPTPEHDVRFPIAILIVVASTVVLKTKAEIKWRWFKLCKFLSKMEVCWAAIL